MGPSDEAQFALSLPRFCSTAESTLTSSRAGGHRLGSQQSAGLLTRDLSRHVAYPLERAGFILDDLDYFWV